MVITAAEPLAARQKEEADRLQQRIEQSGERGSGKKELEDRHKRELRRHRTDELRFGLATLAGAYRDRLVTSGWDAVDAAASGALEVAGRALPVSGETARGRPMLIPPSRKTSADGYHARRRLWR